MSSPDKLTILRNILKKLDELGEEEIVYLAQKLEGRIAEIEKPRIQGEVESG